MVDREMMAAKRDANRANEGGDLHLPFSKAKRWFGIVTILGMGDGRGGKAARRGGDGEGAGNDVESGKVGRGENSKTRMRVDKSRTNIKMINLGKGGCLRRDGGTRKM